MRGRTLAHQQTESSTHIDHDLPDDPVSQSLRLFSGKVLLPHQTRLCSLPETAVDAPFRSKIGCVALREWCAPQAASAGEPLAHVSLWQVCVQTRGGSCEQIADGMWGLSLLSEIPYQVVLHRIRVWTSDGSTEGYPLLATLLRSVIHFKRSSVWSDHATRCRLSQRWGARRRAVCCHHADLAVASCRSINCACWRRTSPTRSKHTSIHRKILIA